MYTRDGRAVQRLDGGAERSVEGVVQHRVLDVRRDGIDERLTHVLLVRLGHLTHRQRALWGDENRVSEQHTHRVQQVTCDVKVFSQFVGGACVASQVPKLALTMSDLRMRLAQ